MSINRIRLAAGAALAATFAAGAFAGPALADQSPAVRKAGGEQPQYLTVRKAGGEPQGYLTMRKAGGEPLGYIIAI